MNTADLAALVERKAAAGGGVHVGARGGRVNRVAALAIKKACSTNNLLNHACLVWKKERGVTCNV